MTIKCLLCGKVFESLIIDKVMGWNECYTNLMQHCMKKHTEVMAQLQVEIQKVMVSVSAYMTCSRLAAVPDDETYINLLLDEFQSEIIIAAGYEEDVAEDEDDDEDDEDGEEGEGEEKGDDEIPDTEVEPTEEEHTTPEEDEIILDVKK